jgi:8-oxo-dGTP pyrophosphatase MutT (NUDIX family)
MNVQLDTLSTYLKERLSQPLPGFTAQKRMGPVLTDGTLIHDRTPSNSCRINGVMLLFYAENEVIRLVLTVRSSAMKKHKGEISYPGGGLEPDETPVMGALRETQEETGLSKDSIQVLGKLSDLYIPVSDNLLKPFVGFYKGSPTFKPDSREVQCILTPELSYFLNQSSIQKENWRLHGYDLIVPCWRIEDRPLWGATAMILNEFLEIIQSRSDWFDK